MPDPNDVMFKAVAFAARAHRHHLRKDKDTPYFAHPVRVCLVVRHVFGFDDPEILAAALLHDTVEDTTTDCDDIIEEFGANVARWVAVLSKDKRRPHDEREDEYARGLAAADWQAKVIKLADLYDNIGDCLGFPLAQRKKTVGKSKFYLDAVRKGLPEQAAHAVALVEGRVAQLESSITS